MLAETADADDRAYQAASLQIAATSGGKPADDFPHREALDAWLTEEA